MIKKPMLAGTVSDIETIKFPVIASPKLDGIRAVMVNGKLLTRSLKPIPNKYIRETLEAVLPDGIDGEIMSGTTFQECTSAAMRQTGEPKFKFHVFDLWSEKPFQDRILAAMEACLAFHHDWLVPVPHIAVHSVEELLAFEEKCLASGCEGVMLRDPNGPYKFGRSTEKEGYLLKLKRFDDSEAKIIGMVELLNNNNELKRDELGHAKRSTAKAGRSGAATMGALKVKDTRTGVEFEIGTGFTEFERQQFWDNAKDCVGLTVKYKYQKHGSKDKPRLPVFLGVRDPRDM